jgi:hypothetical protein
MRHFILKPLDGIFATIHSKFHSGFVLCLTVGVLSESGGSILCLGIRPIGSISATMKGSAESVLISARGRFVARWKVILTVHPGGARGTGVSSKPPAGPFLLLVVLPDFNGFGREVV